MFFSQRKGFTPVKSVLQIDGVDNELRTSLWNLLHSFYFKDVGTHEVDQLCRSIWMFYFKKAVDHMPYNKNKVHEEIRGHFFTCHWYKIYDFLEFIGDYLPRDISISASSFRALCNKALEREMSGYRFVETRIMEITSEEEIGEIEEAVRIPVSAVSKHLQTALTLLTDRKSPDYRNSIKESISAVESICRIIVGDGSATLGKAIGKLQSSGQIELHGSFKEAISRLYGWTSDAEGIRHSLQDKETLDFEDAKFMLVMCSGFVNYLRVKANKAGITVK